MKRIYQLVVVVLTPLLFTGCNQGKPADTAAISQLEARVSSLEAKVLKLQGDVFLASLDGPQESVWFDPQDDKAYLPVKSPAGPVLVILERVEPYLDGFTVSMRIGNPTSANFSGMEATVKWGRKFDAQKGEDFNKISEKKITLKDFMPAGAWTTVKFNVGPATADGVRRIGFAPVFNSLQLRSR